MDFVVCIPTLNPGRWAQPLVERLRIQTLQPRTVLILDSESNDGSLAVWRDAGYTIRRIPRRDFDHGGTRNLAFSCPAQAYLFLTQDALPCDEDAFARVLSGLTADPRVGLAYGRQVARPDASPMVAAHRAFNYPDVAESRSADDIPRLGIKAAFNSNAFAVYRREAIQEIGGFPSPIIGSEDRYVAARMLLAGWRVAYVADAVVEHSHDDSLLDDFRRYFDIGAFQASERWFETRFGRAEGEGSRLVRHQVDSLRAHGTSHVLLRVVGRTGARWLGYRIGRMASRLPNGVSSRLSSQPAYWMRLTDRGLPRPT